MRTSGLSRRAYARQRGCSEAAVRKAIADGRLKKAVLPDGSIDAHRADELLAHSTIASREPPSELSEARVRKLRAQCALLQDEIEELEGALITPGEAEEARSASCGHVTAKVRTMLERLIPRVTDVEAVEASAAIQQEAHQTLLELSQTVVMPISEPQERQKQRGLAKLTGVQLEALKNSLQARRLEVQSEQRDRTLVRLDDLGRDVTARFMTVRTKLLSLHHRSAPQLMHVDVARAREVLSPMVAEIVEALTSP